MKNLQKCSQCKKAGHNARTCKTSQGLTHTPMNIKNQKDHSLPQLLNTQVSTQTTNNSPHIDDAYKKFTLKAPHNTQSQLSGDEPDTSSRYSLADLETLWAISNTETSYKDPRYTEELQKFISHVENLPQSEQPKTETWVKFLKKIPTSVKFDIVGCYPEAAKISMRRRTQADFTENTNGNDGEEVMSEALMNALSYEKSQTVAFLLASRAGLTEETSLRLAKREETHVLLSLAENTEASPESLEIMQRNINISRHRSGEGTPFMVRNNITPTVIMTQIASHPRITQALKEEYLNVLHARPGEALSAPNFYMSILSNPSLTEKELSEELKRFEAEEKTLPQPVGNSPMRIRANFLRNSRIAIYSHPNCPEAPLCDYLDREFEKMSKGKNISLEMAYAPYQNPKVESGKIQKYYTIAKDKDNLPAMCALAQNPQAPSKVVKDFIETYEAQERQEQRISIPPNSSLRQGYEKVKTKAGNP